MANSSGPNLRVRHVLRVAAFLLTTAFPIAVIAQDSLLIDCYRWDGGVSANNTKCPNSKACCGPRATCLSNGLCANPGDGPNLWVRGPCSVKGWDAECAQICKYKEVNGIFPRVTPCDDGSLCCNNDPQCCQDGKGIFLDESGKRVSAKATAATTSYPPVSDGLSRFTLTPSTSTTSTSASASSSSTTSIPTDTEATSGPIITTPPASSPSGSDDSLGLKVGLGLGIPLAILATACVAYFVLRRRGHRADDAAVPAPQYHSPGGLETMQPQAGYYTSGAPYSDVQPKPPIYQFQPYPVEIMGQEANEMDASQYGARERHELG